MSFHPNVKACTNVEGWLAYINKHDKDPAIWGELMTKEMMRREKNLDMY